jgi:hypothetical protein
MEPQKNEPLRADRLNESDGVSSSSDEDRLGSQKAELEEEMLQWEYLRTVVNALPQVLRNPWFA